MTKTIAARHQRAAKTENQRGQLGNVLLRGAGVEPLLPGSDLIRPGIGVDIDEQLARQFLAGPGPAICPVGSSVSNSRRSRFQARSDSARPSRTSSCR